MGTPFIPLGNEEIDKLEAMHIGNWVECPRCDDRHRISGGKDSDGAITETLLYYTCEGKDYLAGVNGKNIMFRFAEKH